MRDKLQMTIGDAELEQCPYRFILKRSHYSLAHPVTASLASDHCDTAEECESQQERACSQSLGEFAQGQLMPDSYVLCQSLRKLGFTCLHNPRPNGYAKKIADAVVCRMRHWRSDLAATCSNCFYNCIHAHLCLRDGKQFPGDDFIQAEKEKWADMLLRCEEHVTKQYRSNQELFASVINRLFASNAWADQDVIQYVAIVLQLQIVIVNEKFDPANVRAALSVAFNVSPRLIRDSGEA